VPVLKKEEPTPLPVLDSVMLDLVYNSVIWHLANSEIDVPAMVVETESVLSPPLALERNEDRLEPSSKSIHIPPASPTPLAADLKVVTGSDSSTAIVEPALRVTVVDFSFPETTPLKTPFLNVASSISLLVIPTVPELP